MLTEIHPRRSPAPLSSQAGVASRFAMACSLSTGSVTSTSPPCHGHLGLNASAEPSAHYPQAGRSQPPIVLRLHDRGRAPRRNDVTPRAARTTDIAPSLLGRKVF